jgi:hypothetical protein
MAALGYGAIAFSIRFSITDKLKGRFMGRVEAIFLPILREKEGYKEKKR